MIFILLHYLLSFVTVASSAHQRFFMLCYFVFCRNFCAPQCACTAVLRSPGGWWGTVTW